MSAGADPATPRFAMVTLGVRALVVLGALVVLAQVARLQLAPPGSLRPFVSDRDSSRSLRVARGDLLDRRGRVLATTRMGSRVVVDPTIIEPRLDRTAVDLAAALGTDPGPVGRKLVGGVLENARREREDDPDTKRVRYLPVGGVIGEDAARRVRAAAIPGVSVERRPVRVGAADDLVGAILGKVGTRDWSTRRVGRMGAEAQFDDRLSGRDGALTYTRDAMGTALWVRPGAWDAGDAGRDARLSIDLEIQRIVREELGRGAEQADAAGARAVVVDPRSGEVLAMDDVLRDIEGLAEFPWYDPKGDEDPATLPEPRERPRYRVLAPDPVRGVEPTLARNRCVRDLYEPGSTFKPFAWALAKTLGLLPDDEIIEIEYGRSVTEYGRVLEDVTPREALSWDDVLRYSSNVGMGIATQRTPEHELRGAVRALGFGRRTGLGVMGEERGIVTGADDWNHWTQTSVGMGYEVAVTPVQMARAFSVFARRGAMAGTLPELRLSAAGRDGRPGLTGDEIIVERVFAPDAARRVRGPLVGVVERMDDADRRFNGAPEPRYSMFGKSGTAFIPCIPPSGMRRPNGAGGYFAKQYTSSFLVAAPADEPVIVVLVVIDDPGPERIAGRRHYGSWVAGPVVRRIVDRVLPYLGVAPDMGGDTE